MVTIGVLTQLLILSLEKSITLLELSYHNVYTYNFETISIMKNGCSRNYSHQINLKNPPNQFQFTRDWLRLRQTLMDCCKHDFDKLREPDICSRKKNICV